MVAISFLQYDASCASSLGLMVTWKPLHHGMFCALSYALFWDLMEPQMRICAYHQSFVPEQARSTVPLIALTPCVIHSLQIYHPLEQQLHLHFELLIDGEQ